MINLIRWLKFGISFSMVWMAGFSTGFSQADHSYLVQVFRDVIYHQGEGYNPIKHRLDIYQPMTRPNAPVLVFIHGGGWISGDKSLYTHVGHTFARQGLMTVLINYRLTPEVRHPGHIQDVARAFAWVRENIHIFGGDPDTLFVSGHSAGAHLASLLALNESYLNAEGLGNEAIQGVVAISGVYLIEPEERALRTVFTRNPQTREDASPIHQFSLPAPPFLFLYAQFDLITLDIQARDLYRLFIQNGGQADIQEIRLRTHDSIIERIGQFGDATTEAIQQFLEDQLST